MSLQTSRAVVVVMKRSVIVSLLAVAACTSEPEVVDTAPHGREIKRTDWFLREISDDGKTIDIVYTMSGVASGCEREGTAQVKESSGKVAIFARKSVTRDKDEACTEELAYVDESVELDEPLGDRSLIGCRKKRTKPAEDEICRDLQRSRDAGVFEFAPSPSPDRV